MTNKSDYGIFSRIKRIYDENDYIEGCILSTQNDFLLIRKINEYMMGDGYSIVNKSDVESITNDNSEFVNFFLEKTHFESHDLDGIYLDNWRAVLISLAKMKEIVCFQFEGDNPDELYAGYIVDVTADTFFCVCVSAVGVRYAEIDSFVISACTRVDFKGLYERNLQIYDQHVNSSIPNVLLTEPVILNFQK